MKKKRKRLLTRLTAAMLILTFSLMCMPESIRNVFAKEIQKAKETEKQESVELPKDEFLYGTLESQEVYIVSEAVNLRGERSKVYNLSDGSILAEQYSTPIHYLDKQTGLYKEIDNSLIKYSDDNGDYYKNGANVYGIKLTDKPKDEAFLEISKDGYSLSLSRLSDDNAQSGLSLKTSGSLPKQAENDLTAKLTGTALKGKEEFDYANKKVKEPDFTPSDKSSAVYEGFFANADLTQEFGANEIHMEITVLSKGQNYVYGFKIGTDNLNLVKNANGSVSVKTNDDEEVFSFSKPTLKDKNGKTSNAVNYAVKEVEGIYYLTITPSKDWLNDNERTFPVKIQTDVKFDVDNAAAEEFTLGDLTVAEEKALLTNENAAILQLQDLSMPNSFTVLSASLKYSYETTAENENSVTVSKIGDISGLSGNFDSTTTSATPQTVLTTENVEASAKVGKVYTKTERLSPSEVVGGNATLSLKTASNGENATLYLEGASAAVLSVTGVCATGLGPNTVTEQFGGDGITHHVNVLNGNLTSVIDLMSVNSNVMPIGLQLVYNSNKHADYDEFEFFDPKTCFKNGFKLNVEQYLMVLGSALTYIDGSGATHKFTQSTNKDNITYYLCSDCNLMCRTDPNYSDTTRYIMYKNDVPYMYFKNGRLRCIAESGKYLYIEYSEPSLQITRVSNCLDGSGDFYNIGNRAQYVDFTYNSSGRLTSLTSNYSDNVSFEYKTVKNASNADVTVLAGVKRSSNYLAKIFYNTNIIVESIIDKQDLGYDFTSFYNDGAIDTIIAVGTDETANLESNYNTIDGLLGFSKATLDFYDTEKKVWFFSSGTQLTHSYAFDESGRCLSSYSGYYNPQSKSTPKNSVALYSYGESGNLRTRSAFSYTEDFTQLNNGDFETLTGNTPSGWTVTTTDTGDNYIYRQNGKALRLTQNSSAEQSCSFNNVYSTTYALGFMAQSSSGSVTLRLDWYGYDDDDAVYFTVNEGERYYGMILCERSSVGISSSLRFTNVGTGADVYIDNVTMSPLDNYAETTWNKTTFVQENKQIGDSATVTTQINCKNQTTTSTSINHPASTVTTTTYAYNENDPYDVTVTSVTKNGNTTLSTTTTETEGSATYSAVTTTYTADNQTLKTFSETFSDIYGLPTKTVGTNGEKTYYVYASVKNNLRLTEKRSCNSTDNLAADASHTSHSNDYVLTYTYNDNGELVSVSDGVNTTTVTDYHDANEMLYQGSGQSWKTDTDKYGNTTAIYEEDNTLKQIQYTYNSTYGQLTRADYNHSSSNYSYANYTYDSYGNLIYENWYNSSGGSDAYSYVYDYANNAYTEVSNGVSYRYKGNVTKNSSGGSLYLSSNLATQSTVTVSGNGYNANYIYTTAKNGYLSNYAYNINGTTYTYSPTYNDLGQVATEYNGTSFTSNYTYDSMGRVSAYTLKNGSQNVVSNTYSYGTNTTSGSQYATTYVRVLNNEYFDYGKSYGYDALGRITNITDNPTDETTISYDGQNRLSSVEIGGYTGTWYAYYYDNNNNLTEIRKRDPNGPPVAQTYVSYEYNAKNQLTSYTKDGTTKYYSYDNLGNPIKYGVASTSASDNLSWTMGNKLSSGTYNDNTFSYKYDCNGIRYEKTVNGITTRMYLEGSTVIAEEVLNQSGTVAHTKYYIYDQTGIAGMVYDGTTYYFVKNIFGDIVAICNEYGAVVETYEYDFWGNITSGGTSGIGKENPFRYRGYYYDDETGFYYLQTRYYDPEICRFISADNLELLPTLSQIPGLLNLYVYCNNNPIMYTDETGEFSLEAIVTIVGIAVLIGLAAGLTIGLVNGATGWDLVGYIIKGGVCGIIAGGVVVSLYIGGVGMSAGVDNLIKGLYALAGGGSAGGSMVLAGAGAIVASFSLVVTVAELLGKLLENVRFSRNQNKIPMEGKPNTKITKGGSFGEYDANGHLSYRVDTNQAHFIKSLQKYTMPHKHVFKWKCVNGIWRYIEEVIAYFL